MTLPFISYGGSSLFAVALTMGFALGLTRHRPVVPEDAGAMNGPLILAAGGTGGHLFPAQAVARELMLRGRRVVVMTDGRGHNYSGAFPGAEIATVPAATFAGRGILGRVAALGDDFCRCRCRVDEVPAFAPAGGGRIWRLSEPAGHGCGFHCADSGGIARAECGARTSKPAGCAARHANCGIIAIRALCTHAPAAHCFHGKSGAPGSSGAARNALTRRPNRGAPSGFLYLAAARARALCPNWCLPRWRCCHRNCATAFT